MAATSGGSEDSGAPALPPWSCGPSGPVPLPPGATERPRTLGAGGPAL